MPRRKSRKKSTSRKTKKWGKIGAPGSAKRKAHMAKMRRARRR